MQGADGQQTLIPADHQQLMRATLHAARILVELRGMQPMGVEGYEIDLVKWMHRADNIELLDALAHHDVASAFFVEMLSNATRAALMPDSDKPREPLDAETTARAYRAANRRAPQNQGFVSDGQLCIPQRLLLDHHMFVGRLHPIAFVAPEGAVRPHPALDYRLVLLLHAGSRLCSVKTAILSGLERLRRLRVAHANMIGGAGQPARLFVIVWRDKFHPLFGDQTKKLRSTLDKIAGDVRAERLTIEAFNVIELQYDATRHTCVPRHIAVDRATEPGIASIRDAEFRTLLLDDIQVRLHDFAPGQIIRIERTDFELGGDELTYCMVRQQPGM